jgi:beta-lactamase class A
MTTPLMRPMRPTLAGTTAALLLTLTACGSDADEPVPSGGASSSASATDPDVDPDPDLDPAGVRRELAALEQQEDARIGVHVLRPATGRTLSYRGGTRAAHASTFKALLAGVLLDDLDDAGLRERLRWVEDDLVANSPVTERHVEGGLTVRRLLAAMLLESDNTATNLLMDRAGGPDGLERSLRDLGDDVTRTDRVEPELNTAVPGDPRDTSTPASLVTTLADLLLDDVLEPERAALLEDWMERSVTGEGLVRAAVPEDWTVADRSGSASYGTRNNVAVVRPPGQEPVVVAVLTSHPDDPDAEPDDTLVARAAEIALEGFGVLR